MKNKPYRVGSLGIVFDKRNNVLIVQLVSYNDDEWAFPGGGRKDSAESPRANILRELTEELGVEMGTLKIVGQANKPVLYDFPDAMTEDGHPYALQFRGQKKYQFFIKFVGEKSKIQLDKKELRKHAWVTTERLSKYFLFPGQLTSARETINEYMSNYLTRDPE